MIKVRNLTYRYRTGAEIQFPDLTIERGAQHLLLGESGSGKTTLLHLMGGLLKIQKGSIVIDETDISSLSESALDHFRGKRLGFVFQRSHLISSLSVQNNLLLASYLGAKEKSAEVDVILARLGLGALKKAKVTELSYGQLQRVAIARAVMNHPTILFADEPTSALDDANCDRVIHLLMDIAAENKSTLIVATHDYRLKKVIANQINLSESR
jgi:ABC-type lipoprotein export system ATPase subunit